MHTKLKNSIQTHVLIGFTLLTLLVVGLVLCIQINAEQSNSLTKERAQLHALSDAFSSIQQSSAIYRTNAARDYESYFRDVEVFYKVTQQSLASIDARIQQLEKTAIILNQLAGSLISLINQSDIEQLIQTIDDTQQAWIVFQSELAEQFGDNKQEPRLEWGSAYIEENSAVLGEKLASLNRLFDRVNDQQIRISKITGEIVIVSLVLFSLFFGLFFYRLIIKPIQNTKQAFQRVSDGDFGHQIKSSQKNEIGQLISSFNLMSARSNTVLSILSKLQTVTSYSQAVEVLFSQLKSYMGCDLVLVIKKNTLNDNYSLSELAPKSRFKNLYKINLAIENQAHVEYMQRVNKEGQAIQMDNIHRYVALNPNAVVLTTLLRRYPLKSAIIQPLNINLNPVTLLFASYHEGQLNQKHLELLNQLMPFISHKLASINLQTSQPTQQQDEAEDNIAVGAT